MTILTEEDMEKLYRMPRPKNPNRLPMAMEKRAAQFAPFAALEGYDKSIEECKNLNSMDMNGAETDFEVEEWMQE